MNTIIGLVLSNLTALWRDERGGSAAEFALVFPAFVLLIFGTIGLSMSMSALIQLHFATEKAARCLSVTPAGSGGCLTNINTYATGLYGGPTINSLSFSASTPSCGNKVTATGTYVLITGIGQISVPLNTSACYPLI
jgi:Flp pilus assembly protein TadG